MGSKKGPVEMLRVVFKGYGEELQARGGGVVVSVKDVVGALVQADGLIEPDRWSGMAMLGAPRVRTCDGVVFAEGRGAVEAVQVHRRWSLKATAVSAAVN